ncbi:MAG: diaminopimelate decarboxylase [Anaerotardibacter sp.]
MSLPAPNPDARADFRSTMDLGLCLPKTTTVENGHLVIGGVDMVSLAKEQGTALYVYDQADLEDRMDSYVDSFKKHYGNAAVCYASKAFLNKAMACLAKEHDMHLDVSGGGELAIAQAVDFPMEKVVVHGNNKTPLELEEAISAGAGRIVVDSHEELNRISEIAGKLGVTQNIFLRITPGVEADTLDYIRTGAEDSKFGFTIRDDYAFKCIKDALDAPNVNLAGLHMHIGSQIFALNSYPEAIDVIIELAARVKNEYGWEFEDIDVGGGLGIAYTVADQPSTIDQFAEVLATAMKESCAKHGITEPRLLTEPGRSIVAVPGVTLYTVGSIKEITGIRKYVAIDGGMSDNIRPALYGASYESVVANKADAPRDDVVTLVGKHCESGDAVAFDASLQTPEVGDIVCMFSTGAYCHSMSSNYNGQPRAGIVFVKDGVAKLVSRRETYADLMACDIE